MPVIRVVNILHLPLSCNRFNLYIMKRISLLLFVLLGFSILVEAQKTICNPLDLSYGCGGKDANKPYRECADPVIVTFKGKYYLFTTQDRGGYRMSDDLIHWKDMEFSDNVRKDAIAAGTHYVAPAVAADSNYVYFFDFNGKRSPGLIIRSSDPSTGKWEPFGKIRMSADPHFWIENGKIYVYNGLGGPGECFEYDMQKKEVIPQSQSILRPRITNMDTCAGYHFGQHELARELEAGKLKYNFKRQPCPEGSWMVKHDGKYYLQYATPGTASQWYCDFVLVGDNPKGPFVEQPYNPISLNVGGFMGSAGHSCVFQDKYENWWQVSTMWVGKYTGFERRVGLFPVKFDKEGRMKVYTRFGEYPSYIPQKKFDPDKINWTGWNLLSKDKECTASSFEKGKEPSKAADEDIRTWWAARYKKPNEWLCMNLGGVKTVRAIQVNFTEIEIDKNLKDADDYNLYKLYVSKDGKNWTLLIDKSKEKAFTHDYVELEKPVKAAYIKIESIYSAKNGKFALSDLRVFGEGNGKLPKRPGNVSVLRDGKDDRYATVKWNKSQNADGYIVQFGYRKDFLNQTIRVKDKDKTSLDIHILIPGQKYYYRVDAYNENGVVEGRNIVAD